MNKNIGSSYSKPTDNFSRRKIRQKERIKLKKIRLLPNLRTPTIKTLEFWDLLVKNTEELLPGKPVGLDNKRSQL